MSEPRTDFRSFALDVYGSEGVPPASVLLQDRCGVDVNLLLLAAFVGAVLELPFTTDDVAAADTLTRQWQREVVGPLRAVRRRLKDGPAPAPNTATAGLRERIKAIELDAEMIELDELADFAARFEGGTAPGAPQARAAAAIQAVISGCTAREPCQDESEAITVIASAAARFGRE